MALDHKLMFMVLHLGGGVQAYDYVDGEQCRNAQTRIDAGEKLSITIDAAGPNGRDVTHEIVDVECRAILERGLGRDDKKRGVE
jgi:hypothetical protein